MHIPSQAVEETGWYQGILCPFQTAFAVVEHSFAIGSEYCFMKPCLWPVRPYELSEAPNGPCSIGSGSGMTYKPIDCLISLLRNFLVWSYYHVLEDGRLHSINLEHCVERSPCTSTPSH